VYMVDSGLKMGKDDRIHIGWDMVKRNVAKVSDLVKDILYASKEREPEYQECDPGGILQDVYNLYEGKARSNGIDLVKEFDSEMGAGFLDPKGIHSVISNLVSNAIEACQKVGGGEKHHITITGSIEHSRVVIRVIDDGTGMPEEVRQNLFKKFYSTKGMKGTGLGLVVTRKIIEEHGGTIRVQSELGKGSTFSVEIPLRGIENKKALGNV
jgi:signal transduction histidine kinase